MARVVRVFGGRVVALVGPFVVTFAVAMLAGMVGPSTGWALVVFLAGTVAALGAISWLCGRWARRWLLVTTAVTGTLAAILVFVTVPAAVLAAHGRTTVAVVDSVAEISASTGPRVQHEWRYQLVEPDGTPIPGRLAEQDEQWERGDRVEVVVDPAGFVDPQTRTDVTDMEPVAAAAAGLAVLTLILAVVTAGWGLRRLPVAYLLPASQPSDDRPPAVRASSTRTRRTRTRGTWPGSARRVPIRTRVRAALRPVTRPLGRTRRILGRAWFALGLLTFIAGTAALIWGFTTPTTASSDIAVHLARPLGILAVAAGPAIALLSQPAAFSRDTRTK